MRGPQEEFSDVVPESVGGAVFDEVWVEVEGGPEVEPGEARGGVSEGEDPVHEPGEPGHFGGG